MSTHTLLKEIMKTPSNIFTLLFLFLLSKCSMSASLEDEMKLINDVIEKRSAFATSDPKRERIMRVNFIFYPLAIIGLDERQQVLSSSGFMSLWWTDPRLSWNASTYGGIERIRVMRHKVWIPDVVNENTVNDFGILGSEKEFVVVSSDGLVEWSPGNIYRTICEVDVTKFPFDSQDCFLNMSTWTYYSHELSLVPAQAPIRLDFYATNSEWNLLNTSHVPYEHKIHGNIQKAVSFHFELKRRSSFYVIKVIVPTIVLSALNSFVFIVPPESGERVSMSVTTMLSLTIFLSYIGDVTPNNSEGIPVIALFVVLHLALGALSIIANIILLDIRYRSEIQYKARDSKNDKVHLNASVISNNEMPNFVTENEHGLHAKDLDDASPSKTAKRVPMRGCVDIFFFVLFLFLSFVVTVTCVLMMTY